MKTTELRTERPPSGAWPPQTRASATMQPLTLLQRAAGNRAVTQLLFAQRACGCGPGCAGGCREEEAGREEVQRNAIGTTVQRYHHSNCKEDDLKDRVWPADGVARKLVASAINAVANNSTNTDVVDMLKRYFMTTSPNRLAMMKVLHAVSQAFADNDYTYECNESCDSNAYVKALPLIGIGFGDIELCMNNLRRATTEIIGRTLLHEFTHRYPDTDDNAYCKKDKKCPDSLSASDALDNADSYACFAYEAWKAGY
jgi:hypothetical protein